MATTAEQDVAAGVLTALSGDATLVAAVGTRIYKDRIILNSSTDKLPTLPYVVFKVKGLKPIAQAGQQSAMNYVDSRTVSFVAYALTEATAGDVASKIESVLVRKTFTIPNATFLSCGETDNSAYDDIELAEIRRNASDMWLGVVSVVVQSQRGF